MSHQDQALELLLSGKTALETARLVGVDPRTIRRWKKDPAFAEELSDLRQEIHDEIMLRAMALVEKLQTAAFAQLEWLKAMADKFPTLTDKLRCMNAISQLNFKWSKFIMDRQDKKTIAQLARAAQPAKKADINGHAVGAKEQTAVSFAPCCEAQPIPNAGANGHAGHSATGAPTAPILKDGSVHPCPVDSPTSKVDANGHRPPEAPKTSATIKPPQQGGTEDTALGSSLAPKPTQNADKSGHPALRAQA